MDGVKLQKVPNIDLNSFHLKDTFGHVSTPAFSVDSELLNYFLGHADAFHILLYGVYPVLSWSSRLSLCTAYISHKKERRKSHGLWKFYMETCGSLSRN